MLRLRWIEAIFEALKRYRGSTVSRKAPSSWIEKPLPLGTQETMAGDSTATAEIMWKSRTGKGVDRSAASSAQLRAPPAGRAAAALEPA